MRIATDIGYTDDCIELIKRDWMGLAVELVARENDDNEASQAMEWV